MIDLLIDKARPHLRPFALRAAVAAGTMGAGQLTMPSSPGGYQDLRRAPFAPPTWGLPAGMGADRAGAGRLGGARGVGAPERLAVAGARRRGRQRALYVLFPFAFFRLRSPLLTAAVTWASSAPPASRRPPPAGSTPAPPATSTRSSPGSPWPAPPPWCRRWPTRIRFSTPGLWRPAWGESRAISAQRRPDRSEATGRADARRPRRPWRKREPQTPISSRSPRRRGRRRRGRPPER
jgi:hypothetical protein